MALRALHLCSGYGGFELGLKLTGVPTRTVCHVERDSYAAATLVARMEDQALDPAPIWSDLTTFDGAAWRGRVDLITAGFPCQPFSAAGLGRGVDDERWLWPDIARIVADVGPRFVFLENVPQLVRLGLPHVLADLATLGFDAEWGLLSASAVGAPHKRERFWLLGHAGGSGRSEVTRSAHGDEGTDGRQPHRSHLADSASEDVADAESPRYAATGSGTPGELRRNSPDLPTIAVGHHAGTTMTDGPNTSPKADLNPRFVERLMNVPDGWSDPTTSVTGFTSWVMAWSLPPLPERLWSFLAEPKVDDDAP